jgi:hypothetical protein
MPDPLATLTNAMRAPRQSSDPQDLIDQLVTAAPNFANNPVIDQMTATAERSRPETVDDFIKRTMEAQAR